ncbi:MAG: hypothetical protein HAW59_03105 [Betaproteobacteria bacterium]|nr:hypothetical protein [Betaproteobacteria bacterium]
MPPKLRHAARRCPYFPPLSPRRDSRENGFIGCRFHFGFPFAREWRDYPAVFIRVPKNGVVFLLIFISLKNGIFHYSYYFFCTATKFNAQTLEI